MMVATASPRRTTLHAQKYAHLVREDLTPALSCDISIVVVTHESADDIVGCLESITEVAGRTIETIVVDNASQDGTAALVAERFPNVRVIRTRRRHGFATNVNIGTVASAGDHVLLLNPDTVVAPGTIEALARFLDDHPDVGAVGPALVYPDGRPQPSARRFPTFLATVVRRTPLRLLVRDTAAIRRHFMADELPSDGADVDWLLGAAMLVRRAALDELDGLDDGYRLYCEDIDLCWRLHEAGWRVTFLASVQVQHALGELTSKRFLTRRTVWHYRSMARFIARHGLGRPQPQTRVLADLDELPLVLTLADAAG